MEFIGDAIQRQKGVGATAEARLIPLTPLIEYYEREMGDLPGRLMMHCLMGNLPLRFFDSRSTSSRDHDASNTGPCSVTMTENLSQ